MSGSTPDDSESPETLPAEQSGTGELVEVVLGNEQATRVAIFNAVAVRSTELVDELFNILKYRARGCNLGASVRAGELLLGLVGFSPDKDTQAPGVHLHGSGPVQVNTNKGGPDRLTQELIDIVRKGNNGGGEKK